MELWLRFEKAEHLQYDSLCRVESQAEWERIVAERRPVSSVLWPSLPLFPIAPREPAPHFQRRHPHERAYRNDHDRNRSYRLACRRLAARLAPIVEGGKALVYAPLRGALPIWNAVSRFLPAPLPDVYFPVTSSFVFYPQSWGRQNDKGRPASGRFAHRLELRRLLPLMDGYRVLVYLDEIVSGGMMAGYLEDMVRLGVQDRIRIAAAGLADDNGRRFEAKRSRITAMREQGAIREFLWEGCDSLVTEDQKFLLGIHYTDYRSGLNVVPVFTDGLTEYPEKTAFEQEVLAADPPG